VAIVCKETSMFRHWGMRVQVSLVLVLFVGSLAVLLYSSWITLALPRRELKARTQLRTASAVMSQAAEQIALALQRTRDGTPDEMDEKLRAIAAQVLADYPGLEGGYFLAREDRFSGYAYPTGVGEKTNLARNEPPPKEAPVIRRQVQETLDTGQMLLRTEDVESSRVVILTQPVGKTWPQRLATWLMVRLIGPELLEQQLHRSRTATYLALGGVLLSLVLTWDLGRVLKRQRREQAQLQDELRRAEHLAGLGKLLAGVAHEVRNPLAALRSTVQLWQRLPDTARTPESLEAVLQAVDRLNGIVTRLLFFSRADNAARQPVDLKALAAETIDLMEAQAKEQGVRIERRLTEQVPPVWGSANALRQVMLNLATNALQAMPAGGVLTCTTKYQAASKQVEFRVTDTGSGIAEEHRQHLFEPFFTTRPDGTGLGLALCREIVNNHRGTIDYLPQDQGATFIVNLPVSEH
jgi:signal transduction histidine kinase